MGFLKKIFGSEEEKEKQESKPQIKKKPSKKVKEEKKESNNFLDQLEFIINEAKTMVSKSPKEDTIQNLAQDIVEGFFYGNVIINFKNNLNDEIQKELNISVKDIKNIEKKFNALFERCEQTLESGSNDKKIDLKVYKDFKKELKQISEKSYKLLLELEKHIDIISCQKRINEFKKEVKNLGKELKIGNIDSTGGSLGISIGFEDDNEDYETEDYEEEITDFNNFEIDLDDEWITIENEKSHFYGQYYQSENKKYLVAYTDAHIKVDKNDKETTISGQVYLVENENKILWQKNIARPKVAFVTDKGVVVVIDWISFSGELSRKIYFFNNDGKKLFEEKFNSNIRGQDISKDGRELIITTCFPENALYLFDIEKKKLIRKVENTTQEIPLINFKFNEMKNHILKSQEFNQRAYDLQKQKEERRIQEKEKKMESLKKEKISNLNHDELVKLGSEYAGDFYGNFGEPKKALRYMLKAIELKQDKPKHHVLKLVGFCFEKLENYKEAIKYYNWSIDIFPQYKKSVVIDHIEFCELKLNNKYQKDWTTYIIDKRQKERNKN